VLQRISQAERYFEQFCSNDKVLLDFGCADGLFLRHLPASRRIGVEVNPHAIRRCEEICREEAIPVTIHRGLDTVEDASVDVAISNHCLEHNLNPADTLYNIKRVLKPGGVFALVVPFDDFREKGHKVWKSGDGDNHLYTWTALNIGNLLAEVGFEVQFARTCTRICTPKIYWVRSVFGKVGFEFACFLLSFLTNRREVFCLAKNRSDTGVSGSECTRNLTNRNGPRMKGRILYLCGGRSFLSEKPIRKISSVVDCWRKMEYEVLHVCGGDILDDSGDGVATEYGAMSFHRQWYRRVGILNPLIRTVSERRDIRHDSAMVTHLGKICNSFKPDLIWERSCRLHYAGLVMARRLGVPYVLEWKDNIASYWLSLYRSRARRMEKRKNSEADFIVTESAVLRSDLIREGIDGGKILVAQNAVDPEKFHRDVEAGLRTRKELGVKRETVLVGYLGSYAWYHGAGRLVKAMDVLRKRYVENVRCLMVGTGKEYDKMRRLAEKNGLLGSAIIMKPGVPPHEVPGILAALDIAVLPGSTDIICPIKIQEYMATELATLAPDYACNREVIDNGRTGMLFTPKDERALAEKIAMLAQDHAMRRTMGQKARKEVEHCFTWEKTWGAALARILAASGETVT